MIWAALFLLLLFFWLCVFLAGAATCGVESRIVRYQKWPCLSLLVGLEGRFNELIIDSKVSSFVRGTIFRVSHEQKVVEFNQNIESLRHHTSKISVLWIQLTWKTCYNFKILKFYPSYHRSLKFLKYLIVENRIL